MESSEYVKEVKDGTFPDDDHTYTVPGIEMFEKFVRKWWKTQADLKL